MASPILDPYNPYYEDPYTRIGEEKNINPYSIQGLVDIRNYYPNVSPAQPAVTPPAAQPATQPAAQPEYTQPAAQPVYTQPAATTTGQITTQNTGPYLQPSQPSDQTPAITEGQLTNLAKWLGPEVMDAIKAGGVGLENIADLAGSAWPVISSFLGDNNNPALNYIGQNLTGLAGAGISSLAGGASNFLNLLSAPTAGLVGSALPGTVFGGGSFLDPTSLLTTGLMMGSVDPDLQWIANAPMMASSLANAIGGLAGYTGSAAAGSAGAQLLAGLGAGGLGTALSWAGPVGLAAAFLLPMIQGAIDMDKPDPLGAKASDLALEQSLTNRLNYFLGTQPGATPLENPMSSMLMDDRSWMEQLSMTPEGRQALMEKTYPYIPPQGISVDSPEYKTLQEQLNNYNYDVWSKLVQFQKGLIPDPMKQPGWTGFLNPRMGTYYAENPAAQTMGEGGSSSSHMISPSGYVSQLWTPEEEYAANVNMGGMQSLAWQGMSIDPNTGNIVGPGPGPGGYEPFANVYDLYGNRSYNDYIARWNAEHPDMQVTPSPKTGAELQAEYQQAVWEGITPEMAQRYGMYDPSAQLFWG